MGTEFGGEVQEEGERFNPDTDKWGSGLLGYRGFPGGSAGKESTCNVDSTWVQPLGWEDPLEKGKATHSSILAWRIPWTEEPGGLQSMGS